MTADDKSGGDPVQDRLADIYRRWARARRQSPWSLWREPQRWFREIGIMVAFFATVFLIFVDFARHDARPLELEHLPRGPWQLGSLILLFLINAAFLGGMLRSRALRTLPISWRIGTALACGVPFLGLYAFAAAARWTSHPGPEEPLSLEAPGISRLSRLRSLCDRWSRTFVRELSAGLHVVTNLLVLLWISWTVPGRAWGTIAFSLLLHAAAASGLVLHALAVARTTGPGRVPLARLLVPASLTLFMVPMVPFLGLILYLFAIPRAPEISLLRTLQQNRSSTARLPRWLELRDILRRARRSWRSGPLVSDKAWELSDTDLSLYWTYVIKAISLGADGATLSWLAFWATEGVASERGAAQALITGIASTSLSLGGAGLVLMLLLALRQRARAEGRLGFLDRHPVHRFLAASQISLATGLFLGGLLFEGDGRRVGTVVALAAACGVAVALPRFLLNAPGKDDRATISVGWTISLAILGGSGFEWANGHESADAMLWLLRVCLAFLPWAIPLLLLRRFLLHLLRPFSLRDLLNPAFSRPLRRSLLFLTATAVLPLGGLAVPAWIWIRYRYWPDFEREWQMWVTRTSRSVNPPIADDGGIDQ